MTPDEYMGDVIGDLNCRRGQIQGTETRGNAQVVNGLRAAGQHVRLHQHPARRSPRAAPQFTMQYDHYEPVPQAVADEVIKKYA